MPDREKVINGLECCCEHIEGMNCDHCPYDEEQIEIGQINQCTSALAYDALALLKEQEAVEPKHNPLSPTDWFCGKCGMCISRFHDYCPSCGQAVKWE